MLSAGLYKQKTIFHRHALIRLCRPHKTGRCVFCHMLFQRHVLQFLLGSVLSQKNLNGFPVSIRSGSDNRITENGCIRAIRDPPVLRRLVFYIIKMHTEAGAQMAACGKSADCNSTVRYGEIFSLFPDVTHCPGNITQRLHFQRLHLKQIRGVGQYKGLIPHLIKLQSNQFSLCGRYRHVSASGYYENPSSGLTVLMQIRRDLRKKAICHRVGILLLSPDTVRFFFHFPSPPSRAGPGIPENTISDRRS